MTAKPNRTLCVVPARGGSKRVPRKNVRPVAGVPMLQRTLEIVVASGVADRVIVSTDDDEIATVARSAGAEVPFMRPAHLADDHTPTAPVISHAIATVEALGGDPFDYVVVVYPTAILLDPHDLRSARDSIVGTDHQVAFSVCRYPAPIERAWKRTSSGVGAMRQPEHALTRTQDLEPAYYDAGQFYFGTRGFWEAGGALSEASPLLIELPPWRAIDIDTEDDLELAARWLQTRPLSVDEG